MMNTKNALIALSAPPSAQCVPVMSRSDAVAFLDQLVSARPAQAPAPPALYGLARTVDPAPVVDVYRTPAPIRALKDEGIIGVV